MATITSVHGSAAPATIPATVATGKMASAATQSSRSDGTIIAAPRRPEPRASVSRMLVSHMTNVRLLTRVVPYLRTEARSHERKTIPSGASLATETKASAVGASRLKRRLQPGLAAPLSLSSRHRHLMQDAIQGFARAHAFQFRFRAQQQADAPAPAARWREYRRGSRNRGPKAPPRPAPARSSDCVARGPAPTRIASSVRVRRTTSTAYSISASLHIHQRQRIAHGGQLRLPS